jgi:hypothetical protein
MMARVVAAAAAAKFHDQSDNVKNTNTKYTETSV